MAKHRFTDKQINEMVAPLLRNGELRKAAKLLKLTSKENQRAFIERVTRGS